MSSKERETLQRTMQAVQQVMKRSRGRSQAAVSTGPQPPTPATVTDGTLKFMPSRDPATAGYNVYRSRSNNPGTGTRIDYISQPGSLAGALAITDTPPKTGRYYYWIAAVNSGGGESARIGVGVKIGVSAGSEVQPANILDYGAVGDGATDDAAAAVAAFAAADIVFLPVPYSFYFASGVTIPAGKTLLAECAEVLLGAPVRGSSGSGVIGNGVTATLIKATSSFATDGRNVIDFRAGIGTVTVSDDGGGVGTHVTLNAGDAFVSTWTGIYIAGTSYGVSSWTNSSALVLSSSAPAGSAFYYHIGDPTGCVVTACTIDANSKAQGCLNVDAQTTGINPLNYLRELRLDNSTVLALSMFNNGATYSKNIEFGPTSGRAADFLDAGGQVILEEWIGTNANCKVRLAFQNASIRDCSLRTVEIVQNSFTLHISGNTQIYSDTADGSACIQMTGGAWLGSLIAEGLWFNITDAATSVAGRNYYAIDGPVVHRIQLDGVTFVDGANVQTTGQGQRSVFGPNFAPQSVAAPCTLCVRGGQGLFTGTGSTSGDLNPPLWNAPATFNLDLHDFSPDRSTALNYYMVGQAASQPFVTDWRVMPLNVAKKSGTVTVGGGGDPTRVDWVAGDDFANIGAYIEIDGLEYPLASQTSSTRVNTTSAATSGLGHYESGMVQIASVDRSGVYRVRAQGVSGFCNTYDSGGVHYVSFVSGEQNFDTTSYDSHVININGTVYSLVNYSAGAGDTTTLHRLTASAGTQNGVPFYMHQQATHLFQDRSGAGIWQMGLQFDNTFFIFNGATNQNAVIIQRDGSVTITNALVVSDKITGGNGLELTVGDAVVDDGWLYCAKNTTALASSSTGGGLAVSWNQSGSAGEVNFWNRLDSAGNSFRFSQKTGAGSFIDLLTLATGGCSFDTAVAVGGSMDATSYKIAGVSGAGTGATINVLDADGVTVHTIGANKGLVTAFP